MLARLTARLRSLGDRGATAVEIGLIIAGVGIAAIGGLTALNNALSDSYREAPQTEVGVCLGSDANCAYAELPPGVGAGTEDLQVSSYGSTTAAMNSAFSISAASASGGTSPYIFTKVSGPSWLAVDSNGAVSGTTGSASGSFPFSVQVTDAAGATALAMGTVVVPGGPLSWDADYALASAPVNTAFVVANPGVSGGTGDYAYAKLSGDAWITVDSVAGGVSGTTPCVPGVYGFSVAVLDGVDTDTASGQLTVSAGADLTWGGDYEATYSPKNSAFTISSPGLTGGAGSVSFTKTAGATWIAVDQLTGDVSGTTPNGNPPAGPYPFTVTATDACGTAVDASGAIVIGSPVSWDANYGTQSVTTGSTFSVTSPGVSAGATPYTYAMASGAAWIGVSNSGVVNGTAPLTPGTYPYSVTVTDAAGGQAVATGSIVVNDPPVWDSNYGTTTKNKSRSFTVTRPGVTGGVSPYSYTKASGASWISVNGSTGEVTGTTPNTAGTYNYSVTVTDSDGGAATATGSIVVVNTVSWSANYGTTTKNKSRSFTVTRPGVTGGVSPYSYTKASGASWISVNGSTGEVTGTTPNTAGTYNYSVTVTDADGGTATATGSIVVVNTVSWSATYGTTTRNTNRSFSVNRPGLSGGVSPYSYTKTTGESWIVVNGSTGQVTGTTPTTKGTYNYSVTVTDSDGGTATTTGRIVVN